MKTEKEQIIISEIYYKELETKINTLGIEGKQEAIELAKDNASLNLPLVDSQPNIFVGAITVFFGKGIGYIRTSLSSSLSKFNEIEAKKEVETQIKSIQKESDDLVHKLRLKEREKQKREDTGLVPLKKESRWQKLRIFNFFVILLDIAISSSAFQKMGYNLLPSLAIGLGVGIAIYLLSENFPEIINRGKTKTQRVIIGVLTYLGLTIVFYVLGVFRSKGLDSGEDIVSSPWYFCCLNLFFYSVTSIVALLNKPTLADRKQLDLWHTLLDEIAELERRKKECETKEQNVLLAYHKKREEYDKIYSYACSLEALVSQLYRDAIQSYISTNIQYRSDSVVPDFFNHPISPLELYFTHQQK